MVNETKQDLGLAILSSGLVWGAWSAWSSSIFTVATFVDNEQKYKDAKLAMNLGLGTAAAIGLGIHFTYGKKGDTAAIAAVLTGGALYAAYDYKLKQNPNLQPMFEQMRQMKVIHREEQLHQQRQQEIRQHQHNTGPSKLVLADLIGHAMWFI